MADHHLLISPFPIKSLVPEMIDAISCVYRRSANLYAPHCVVNCHPLPRPSWPDHSYGRGRIAHALEGAPLAARDRASAESRRRTEHIRYGCKGTLDARV